MDVMVGGHQCLRFLRTAPSVGTRCEHETSCAPLGCLTRLHRNHPLRGDLSHGGMGRRAARSILTSGTIGSSAITEPSTSPPSLSYPGVSANGLQLADFEGLRGVQATQPIQSGDTLVNVLGPAAIRILPEDSCPCTNFVRPDFWKQAPWYAKAGVLLLAERSGQLPPTHTAYLRLLPETLDTPVLWTDSELDLLANPPMQEKIKQQRREWADLYTAFSEAYCGPSPAPDKQTFLWALQCVRSRAFSGPHPGPPIQQRLASGAALCTLGAAYVVWAHVPLESALNAAIAAALFNLLYDVLLSGRRRWYALLPGVDSINHSSHVESDVAYRVFGDSFELTTGSSFQPGEQVFISYGLQSNDTLLQYYGFVEQDNRHERVQLDVADGESRAQGLLGPDGSFQRVSGMGEVGRQALVQAGEALKAQLLLAGKQSSGSAERVLRDTLVEQGVWAQYYTG
uniref:SET domain-containing protein n=1 Tax=Auxenochlorella protothecoides TaxID=3075 RepID=A0A1D1ZPQ4_AUXPR